MNATVVISAYARQIMSKRLGVKAALAIAALSAMTLLQGCGEEEGFVIGAAWAPIGSVPLPGFMPGFSQGAAGGTGQSTGGTAVATGTP